MLEMRKHQYLLMLAMLCVLMLAATLGCNSDRAATSTPPLSSPDQVAPRQQVLAAADPDRDRQEIIQTRVRPTLEVRPRPTPLPHVTPIPKPTARPVALSTSEPASEPNPAFSPTPVPTPLPTGYPEAHLAVQLEQADSGPVAGEAFKVDFTITNRSHISAFDIVLDIKTGGPGRVVSAHLARGECEEATCRVSSFDGKESVTGYVMVVPETGFDKLLRVDADVSWELTNSQRRHSYDDATARVADGGRPGDLLWLTLTEGKGGSCGTKVQVGPDTVYAVFAKKLYAVSRESGEVIWVADSDTTMFHPYLAGRNIYLHSIERQRPPLDRGYIRSLDAANGELNWQHEIGGQIRGPGVLYGSSVFYIANVQRAGSIFWQYHLLALDASTGRRKLSFPVEEYVSTPAMELDGSIYFGTYSEGPDFLYSVEPQSGRLSRRYILPGGAHTTPLVTESTIYTVTGYGNLRSFDLSRGQENWVYGTDGMASRTPVLSNGNIALLIYYPDESEFLSVEGIDASTGNLTWRYRPGEPLTQPTASDRSIFVPTKTSLVSLDAQTGNVNWQVGYSYLCSPPTVVDGVLYGRTVIENDFYIYAIRGE